MFEVISNSRWGVHLRHPNRDCRRMRGTGNSASSRHVDGRHPVIESPNLAWGVAGTCDRKGGNAETWHTLGKSAVVPLSEIVPTNFGFSGSGSRYWSCHTAARPLCRMPPFSILEAWSLPWSLKWPGPLAVPRCLCQMSNRSWSLPNSSERISTALLKVQLLAEQLRKVGAVESEEGPDCSRFRKTSWLMAHGLDCVLLARYVFEETVYGKYQSKTCRTTSREL